MHKLAEVVRQEVQVLALALAVLVVVAFRARLVLLAAPLKARLAAKCLA
jgi:hypothetical protein